MATLLSDTPLAPNILTWQSVGVFVPFTAFLKVTVPTSLYGQRIATYRYMEKMSAQVESALDTVCLGSEGPTAGEAGTIFDFAKPVAFTPQFGNKTARLTITGHACKAHKFVNEPLNEVLVDNESGELTGYDASNKSNAVPNAAVDTLAKNLRLTIEAVTGFQVIELTVANYHYGYRGTTLP